MRQFLLALWPALLVGTVLGLTSPALAARRTGMPCPGGRFVIEDAVPLMQVSGDPVVLDLSPSGGIDVLGGVHGCTRPPDSVRMRPRRRFTRVTARWAACEGVQGPVVFRGRIGPRCSLLKGTLITRRARQKTTRVTAALTCPLDAGRYTLLPAGPATFEISNLLGTSLSLQPVVLEVGPGDGACRHDVVVPYPGGFERGVGCVAGATFAFEQRGCGVGLIDSDGGSDFTVSETGDTSDHAVCKIPQHAQCASGADSSLRIDATVGDGIPDACSAGGAANVLLSVPIVVTVWSDQGGCPAPDGTYDAGSDSLIARVELVANLSTAMVSARFADLDGDGCAGAIGGSLAGSGTCLDVSGRSLTLFGSAPGSTPATGDFVSSLRVPLTISERAAAEGVQCGDPPPIPIGGGTATLCSVPAGCGDGIVGQGEQCDGANDAACPGGCRGDCVCATCMNDVAEAGEACDWSDDAACPQQCQPDCTCGPTGP
jgi:hypothetical protein